MNIFINFENYRKFCLEMLALITDIDNNCDIYKRVSFSYGDFSAIDMQRLMGPSYQICCNNVLNVADISDKLSYLMYCMFLLFNEYVSL